MKGNSCASKWGAAGVREKIIKRTPAEIRAELDEVRECPACGILQTDKTCWRCRKVKTREWFSDRSFTTRRLGRYR